MIDVTKQMQQRLTELKQEYRSGEGRLREIAQQELTLREALLRISGAIQVLEELLEPTDDPQTIAANGRPGSEFTGGTSEILTVP